MNLRIKIKLLREVYMKEKISMLKESVKDIYEKATKYQEMYTEVEKNFNALPLRKNYLKEDTLQGAMDYYLYDITDTERKIINLMTTENDIDCLRKISVYMTSDEYVDDNFSKLLDYKSCGVIELANLKEELVDKIVDTEELMDGIKDEFKKEPHVKFVADKAEAVIATVGSIVAPYKEVATEQFNTLKEIGINRFNDTKNKVEEKINKGIKTLSKTLDDFANRNNK